MQFDQLKRRDFITLLGGAAAAWPLAAHAQQAAKLPTIGFLGSGTSSTLGPRVAAFVQRLRELGWIESRTVTLEYRWAEGHRERATEIAAEFVRLKVDVIVTSGTPFVIAAKQATAAIPIVFANASDPVGTGLVASLARPDGNVTGLSNQQPDTTTKRLALLREAVPHLRLVAVMGNADTPPVRLEMQEVQAVAGTLGLDCAAFEIRRAGDIAPAFDTMRQRAQGLYLAGDPLTDLHRLRISILALGARLPTIWPAQENVDAGLMSYGPNFTRQWRRAGDLVDKILRGTKPADIPVEQPVKFDLVVNLIVAKALGLEIPTALLARADEIIE
jgi:putative tryptophan/tyrosine transport system substrate-binding protein